MPHLFQSQPGQFCNVCGTAGLRMTAESEQRVICSVGSCELADRQGSSSSSNVSSRWVVRKNCATVQKEDHQHSSRLPMYLHGRQALVSLDQMCRLGHRPTLLVMLPMLPA